MTAEPQAEPGRATPHHPQMSVTEFEGIAHYAYHATEKVRLEFVYGQMRGKAVPDGNHGAIIEWLTRICMQQRPELWLDSQQGLKVETYRKGRVIPDGSLVPSQAFAGSGEWAEPDPVLMVVEITSYDSDTDRRDRKEKPAAYAETGIPLFLLIDRDDGLVKVHSEPDGVRYERVQMIPFGKEVTLPDPVGITLDTEPLKNWTR